ncbi:hypothetical protein ACHQM5_003730 [Ranunculus cassubicifolius]
MASKQAAIVLLLACLIFFSIGEKVVAQTSSDCAFKGDCKTKHDCEKICNDRAAICVPYKSKLTCCCLIQSQFGSKI